MCGEDYQGYSVVNLTDGAYRVYFPERGFDGWGFCWVNVFPSPDGQVIAVDGCFWACSYELVFYDFRQPDAPPFSELERVDDIAEAIGWTDENTFEFQRELEVRRSDGVPYDELTTEEQEILDNDSTLTDYKMITVRRRPPRGDDA